MDPMDRDELLKLINLGVAEGLLRQRTERIDIIQVANYLAAIDSARYYVEHMLMATPISSRDEILVAAFNAATLNGLILEFGVGHGHSLRNLAGLTQETVFGFDSFEGLPEAWRTGFPRGAFARENPPELPHNVELLIGYFEDTLPQFVQSHNGPAKFVHVDCDLYRSTKTIFRYLHSWITPGTIILFDEYFNYPGWRVHEYKAFREFVDEFGLEYEYLFFQPNHKQVAVKVLRKSV